ncbi:MAG: enoyl-CoA hydratase/isomerase family protein, partial [Syntrophales bacterium]|nr:enoyl-CoA hydratase/isomerase family protein [Syntrophales bacterium]
MTDADIVLYEKQDAIAFLTINRPEAMNALNTEVNLKLIECLDRAENEQDIRVIILKGAGDAAFIAGGDIKEMIDKDAMGARNYALAAKRVVDRIWNLSKPVIASIQGFCLGGGLE